MNQVLIQQYLRQPTVEFARSVSGRLITTRPVLNRTRGRRAVTNHFPERA